MNKKPELLWKKESIESDAFYVDIFNGVRSMDVYVGIMEAISQQKLEPSPKKNNELALSYRNEGNRLYIRKDFNKAIVCYNKSLCYAEIGSDHVSFAYGNRSLCFVQLKMYERCLVDIQLATDANYPERLMHKLENRKALCLERIQAEINPISSSGPTLSFDADNVISSIANILKIKRNDRYGRHIITESDIEIAQTVIIEKPLCDVLIGSEYSRCSNCFKENMNFIACKKCVNAMFCNETCLNSLYHRYECDLYKLFVWESDGYFRNMLQLTIRMVLMGVSLTSTMTVDEMMQLVACTNVTDGGTTNEIVIANDTVQSKYETLLKLSSFIPTEKELYDGSIQMACLAYDLLLECTEIRKIFLTITHRRFLMHLTTHLSGTFKTNRLTLAEINKFTFTGDNVEYFGLAIYNLKSYLNHCCVPNIALVSYGNMLVCKATRAIKKGEQLFIDYVDIGMDTKKTARKNQLMDVYGFSCDCELCLLNSETLTSNVLMKTDSNFVFVERYFNRALASRKESDLKNLRDKSMKFLIKWGRMKPCRELFLIQKYFSVLLQMLKNNDF